MKCLYVKKERKTKNQYFHGNSLLEGRRLNTLRRLGINFQMVYTPMHLHVDPDVCNVHVLVGNEWGFLTKHPDITGRGEASKVDGFRGHPFDR